MRDAILWTRILNEGIDLRLYHAAGGTMSEDEMIRHILASKIIVDHTQDFSADFDLADFNGETIAPPLKMLWMEFPKKHKTATGVFFWCSEPAKIGGDYLHQVICLQAIDGMTRPNASPTCYLECSPSRMLTNTYDGYTEFRNKNGMPHSRGDSPAKQNLGMLLGVLRLLACKNVSLDPHENDPKQVRRAVKRHGGDSDSYRYHTLVVRPPGNPSNSRGEPVNIMPYHLCRGHIARYGPKYNRGLLFGKYEGEFYMPPSIKGDKKNGVVEKDYEVPALASVGTQDCERTDPVR